MICRLKYLLAGCFLCFGTEAFSAQKAILVELFTSEGCSSCPPADAFLSRLDGRIINRVEVITLGEHVDYWDHLGWKDGNGREQLTSRQRWYASRFRNGGVYTPQMVIDGTRQAVGSDETEVFRLITEASASEKLDLGAHLIQSGSSRTLEITAHETVPRNLINSVVYVAEVLESANSNIKAGENAGRKLVHHSVVKKLTCLGPLRFSDNRKCLFKIGSAPLEAERLVLFVQDDKTGNILAAQRFSRVRSCN